MHFAPGPVPDMWPEIKIKGSHRSQWWREQVKEGTELLMELLHREFAGVVPIQGSASAALEAVAQGLVSPSGLKCLVVVKGTFGERLADTLARAGWDVWRVRDYMRACDLLEKDGWAAGLVAGVQYESSESQYQDFSRLFSLAKQRKAMTLLDAVSGWPYYAAPVCTDVMVTSSSKQLRGAPVLGLVAYGKLVVWKGLHGYLSISEAIRSWADGQTPHTPMMPQWLTLLEQLRSGDYARYLNQIPTVCQMFEKEFTTTRLLGDQTGPIITLWTDRPQEVQKKLLEADTEVYVNAVYMKDRMQVCAYSYLNRTAYAVLINQLKELL